MRTSELNLVHVHVQHVHVHVHVPEATYNKYRNKFSTMTGRIPDSKYQYSLVK